MVHEEALADQSTALTRLMRGEMSESLAGETKWKDVDKETFIRFTQFAYTGDYSVPTMIAKPSDQVLPQDPHEEMLMVVEEPPVAAEEPAPQQFDEVVADDAWAASWGTSKKNKKKKGSWYVPRPPTPIFNSLTYPLLKPRSKFAHTCDAATSEGSSENISEVLLSHASLYILAEKWGVDSLKRLTLFKLHQTLSMLRLDGRKVPHIVELARYGYSDDNTPDLKTGIDELRELICLYIAANAMVMSEHTTFMNLIEEGGAFVRDLWGRIVPKMPLTE
jgi:hypothetical protein